jgi:hypothetical protein
MQVPTCLCSAFNAWLGRPLVSNLDTYDFGHNNLLGMPYRLFADSVNNMFVKRRGVVCSLQWLLLLDTRLVMTFIPCT